MCLLLACVLTALVAVGSARAQEADIASETCLDCHDAYDKTLASTAHRLTADPPTATFPVACVSCHTGAAAHLDDPDIGTIGNPAKQLSAVVQSTCTQCHAPHHQGGVAGFDPHLNQDISCTDCHAVHSGHEGQLIDTEAGFCGKCHVAVVGQFRRRSNHPLTDQAVSCLSCHNVAGDNDVSFGHGNDANCYRCHPEQSGPYRYEHEAASSFVTDGDGCTACHQPHGSPNQRLLTQPGDGLCRQCHGVPPLHLVKHGGLGTQYACLECHSEVHGSYDSRVFLDPQMDIIIGGQDGACYCHGLGEL